MKEISDTYEGRRFFELETASAFLKERRYTEAQITLEKFLKRKPGFSIAHARAHFYLGQAHFGMGEYSDAARSLTKSLAINPGDRDAMELYDLSSRLHSSYQNHD